MDATMVIDVPYLYANVAYHFFLVMFLLQIFKLNYFRYSNTSFH